MCSLEYADFYLSYCNQEIIWLSLILISILFIIDVTNKVWFTSKQPVLLTHLKSRYVWYISQTN